MADEHEIDEPIRDLVDELSSMMGIFTMSSCGGHKNPKPGQTPEGTWNVSFAVDPLECGWRWLGFLAYCVRDAAAELGDIDAFALHVWCGGDFPTDEPSFSLEGRNGDPDRLVKCMKRYRELLMAEEGSI